MRWKTVVPITGTDIAAGALHLPSMGSFWMTIIKDDEEDTSQLEAELAAEWCVISSRNSVEPHVAIKGILHLPNNECLVVQVELVPNGHGAFTGTVTDNTEF
jgi:hypothetical protein